MTIGTDTIDVVMTTGTDIQDLTATFTVSLAATSQPGSPITQDFTNPVEITVTAEDNTVKVYTITVTVAQ